MWNVIDNIGEIRFLKLEMFSGWEVVNILLKMSLIKKKLYGSITVHGDDTFVNDVTDEAVTAD